MIDHTYTPFANPRVNPGCVRCPRPADEHPKEAPEPIPATEWEAIVRRAQQVTVYGEAA